MKVLYCSPKGGAFHHITQSIIRCLNAAGIETIRWNGNEQVIRNFKPKLYMGCSGHRQNFPHWARQEYGTKVGIHVNPYTDRPMPKVNGNNINEPQDAIDWTVQAKPDFVYCYASGQPMKRWYHLWTDRHGISVVPMENAGDILLYKPVPKDQNFLFDIGFLGGRWGYKAHNLDKYIMPLFEKYKCGVFGWGGWPKNKSLTDEEGNILFASSKVCPAVSEPHTTQFGIDIPERIFKVPLSGGFTISDPVAGIRRLLNDSFPVADGVNDWFDMIEYYIKNDDERIQLAKKQRKHMLDNHTYVDRMVNLFNSIDEVQSASKLSKYKMEYLLQNV